MSKGSVDPAESALLAWKYVFLVEFGKYVLEAAQEKLGEKYFLPADASLGIATHDLACFSLPA
jgi:hypothetical protein